MAMDLREYWIKFPNGEPNGESPPILALTIPQTRLKKDRGWTDSLIKRFAPEPDRVCRNPSGGRMRLYNVARVVEIEQTELFKEMIGKVRRRKLTH